MISTFIAEHVALTRALLVVGVVSVVLVAVVLARRGRAGRPTAAALALVSWLAVAGLTLTPDGRMAERSCQLEPDRFLGDTANVALFLLPVILSVVATRSPLLVLVAAPMLSVAIESTQYLLPSLGRRCDIDDVFANTGGAVIGVLVGAVILWAAAIGSRRQAIGARGQGRRATDRTASAAAPMPNDTAATRAAVPTR